MTTKAATPAQLLIREVLEGFEDGDGIIRDVKSSDIEAMMLRDAFQPSQAELIGALSHLIHVIEADNATADERQIAVAEAKAVIARATGQE